MKTILSPNQILEIKQFYRGDIELSDGFSEPAGYALRWRKKGGNSGIRYLQGKRKPVKDIQNLVATIEELLGAKGGKA